MTTTRFPSLRNAVVLVLGLSVGVGAGMAIAADGHRRPAAETPASPDFDSPEVVGMPMGEARSVLADAGYDVMLVGRGKVVLQELGFEGQLLRLEGEDGDGRRYCDASSPRCVAVRG